MEMHPIWNLKSLSSTFERLENDISVDVAIIGGGITGITTAQLLKDQGLKVAVFEARKIGQGTTGQSTGNLYATTEYLLQELERKYDLQTLKQIISARSEAIQQIRNNINKYQLDCDFHSRPMFLFKYEGSLDIPKEHELANDIGLTTSILNDPAFPFPYDNGIIIENQAQFNPLAYTQQLANNIKGDNCRIFEDSNIVEIEKIDTLYHLTANNKTIKTTYVVHATHTPKGLLVEYHTTLGPYREYGIGVKLKSDQYPVGIFWGYLKNKKISVRTYGAPDDPYLIAVGAMHKVGQADDNRKNLQQLEDFVKKHFDVQDVRYRWGGQNYKPADMLPYIGPKTSNSKEYIATGFSTDGLVYGTLSAKLISDSIASVENPHSELFKANRHQPLKAAEKFIKENVNVIGKLVGDYFKKGDDENVKNMLPGEGKLLQYEDGKYAVYKNPDGRISVLSPICPHMGCTVHFNNAEKTWDCPCHGSRFETSGKLIEGPALHGLKPID